MSVGSYLRARLAEPGTWRSISQVQLPLLAAMAVPGLASSPAVWIALTTYEISAVVGVLLPEAPKGPAP